MRGLQQKHTASETQSPKVPSIPFMPVPAIIISTNIWQKSISVPMPLPNSAPVIKEVISLLYPWDGGWAAKISWPIQKLRFSWGQTGSTNIDDFVYRQFYEKGNPYIGQSTLTPGLLPNPDIKWERTSEFNGGLDYAFFNHRLFGSIDGYYRYTKGALAPSPYPLESGSTSYTSNLIDLSNKGVEIEIGGDIIRTADWTWTSKFNIALNRNKIEKLNGAELSSNDVDTYIEGQPAGVLKGYIVEKIFQNDDEVVTLNKTAVARGANYYQEKSTGMGDFKYKDLDGNGYICLLYTSPSPRDTR